VLGVICAYLATKGEKKEDDFDVSLFQIPDIKKLLEVISLCA
jgi:hypothetical protein